MNNTPLLLKSSAVLPELQLFAKDTLIQGQPAQINCVEIEGQTYSVTRGPLTVVSLEDEWYEDVRDPESVVASLKSGLRCKPDLFTFWQRLPDVEPKYHFHLEWEFIAALPVQSYQNWFTNQISGRTRNLIRKAKKDGIEVRETTYDDAFVRGVTAIFNEAPVRQGRPFWHYGKEFETVKRQFSRFLFREHLIGAYYLEELIGFIMLGNAGRYGLTAQIIASLKHRDKAINNALIAKAVEVCEKKNLPCLVYLSWTDDSLTEFKRRCGFEKVALPRFFVPLSPKGAIALKVGAHHGLRGMLPRQLKNPLKRFRRFYYSLRQT